MTFTYLSQRPRARISLTPLIDVVFILLLFFMLTSTFSPLSALDIQSVTHGSAQVAAEVEPLIIQVVDDAIWLVDGVRYSFESDSLQVMLQQAIEREAEVLLRGGEHTSVQHMVSALSYLQQQGVSHLNIGESVGAAGVQ